MQDNPRPYFREILILTLLLVLATMVIYPGKSLFAGGHTIYELRNSTGTVYGDAYFCQKCHSEAAGATISTSAFKAHNSTTCICHGYYPGNVTITGPYGNFSNVSINLKHNLTKDAYCTNCHTDYNGTGSIPLGNGVDGRNQSGHYIYFNGSDRSSVVETYNRSRDYFVDNSFV
jgi:hypothetical protein